MSELQDPYPNGQGDGTDAPVPPVVALMAVDAHRMAQRIADGGWPWPPFEAVEASPCGHRDDIPGRSMMDGRARTVWCDRPQGHFDEPDEPRHRTVTDLDGGTALLWGGQ